MKPFCFAISVALITVSCSNDDDVSDPVLPPQLEVPATFTFERDGQSTVNFPGQTQRILMGEEMRGAFLDFTTLDANPGLLDDMFANANNTFANTDLNASSRQIRNTVADSEDFFLDNATEAAIIRAEFDSYIDDQIDDIRVNRNRAAASGVSGQIADGTSTRYVTGEGLEPNQLFTKGLVGALMLDQIVNNYVSVTLLDAGTNREDNDNQIPRNDNGTDTQMEHFWDEAYGYVYGTSIDETNPNATIGNDDNFLNRYIGLVDRDPDFNGIAETIFQAFLTGRAAITQNFYDVRDEQAEIIREQLAIVTAVRGIFYLQSGGREFAANNEGGAFHDISEGLGFIISLQFTRRPNSDDPYFTREQVNGFIDTLLGDGPNGLWDVTQETLDAVSASIAAEFDFTVEQAGSSN